MVKMRRSHTSERHCFGFFAHRTTPHGQIWHDRSTYVSALMADNSSTIRCRTYLCHKSSRYQLCLLTPSRLCVTFPARPGFYQIRPGSRQMYPSRTDLCHGLSFVVQWDNVQPDSLLKEVDSDQTRTLESASLDSGLHYLFNFKWSSASDSSLL